MTKPQIELMLHDQPVVDYKTSKKGKKNSRSKRGCSSMGNVREKAEKALQEQKFDLDSLDIKGVTFKI